MKLIEAMKQEKDLLRKANDYREKIGKYCAHPSYETATYGDKQREQVDEWIQGHSDLLKEVSKLRLAIQRTNIQTQVTIEIGGKQISKCISEWIYRRRDLAQLERDAWKVLGDKGIKEGIVTGTQQDPVKVTVVRYYDPKIRDEKVEEFTGEKALIDSRLEVINAVTDLIE